MKTRLTISLFLTLAWNAVLAQLYTYTNFSHKDGLQMSSVKALAQSKDGMLWIGTDGAELFQFDGREFRSFEGANQDVFHHAVNLYLGSDEIYLASRYKGFYSIDLKKNTIKKVLPPSKLAGESHLYFKNSNYSLFVSPCGIAISTDNSESFKKEFHNCDLQIHDVVQTPSKSIILSNKGIFVTSGKGLISLKQWLNKTLKYSDFQFGYYYDSRITLFDRTAEQWIEIVLDEKNDRFFSILEYEKESVLQSGATISAFDFNASSELGAAVTDDGSVYTLSGKSKNDFNYQILNSEYSIERPSCLLIDNNAVIWIGSSGSGLYKLSKEPFTQLKFLDLYTKSDIALPFKTSGHEILISLFSNETHVLSQWGKFDGRTYNFTTNSVVERSNNLYLGTNRGLKKMRIGETGSITDLEFDNQNINLVFWEENRLYVGLAGQGLIQLAPDGEQFTIVDSLNKSQGKYFYTAQSSSEDRSILFGTNDGIYNYSIVKNQLTRVPIDYKKWGGYSGVSTKDAFGKCWFTLDRAIVRIENNKVTYVIDATKQLKTNLIYTLVSDIYGNLFIGTNKGIFRVKVDRSGKIREIVRYDEKLGFDGYETNMRAQFVGSDAIYLGTVEGLFEVSPELFERFPIPSVPSIQNVDVDNESSKWFNLRVNNPKTSDIKYIYRLKGQSDKWFSIDTSDQIKLSDLSNGTYVLEVKASYDGVKYSDPAYYPFTINKPIWKSSLFVIIVIILIVGLNVLLIRYNKAFDTTSLLDTKDTVIHLKMTPGILAFGFVSVSFAHILAPFLDTELEFHAGPTLFTSFVLLILFLLSLSVRSSGTEKKYYNKMLLTGLIVVQAHFFYELWASQIHPFHLIGIVLVSMITPYVLTELKQTVVYSIILLAISFILITVIPDPVYSKVYFLIAIFVLSCLLIFISYLRYNSLEKLLFISSIVNRGNLPALAFDRNGQIQYVSENIYMFADIHHDELLKKNISYLNNFVPFDEKYKETDVLSEFQDGSKYLVPMRNRNKQVRWVEWSYKQFTDELRLMIGQDVTERMELENTYELLVQNAEDFIYRCDVDGNFTFLNNATFEKLGYTKEDLIGKSSLSIVDPAYKEEVEHYYNDHFVQLKTTSYREFPIRTKENALIWVGQYVTTLFMPGSDSIVRGFIALDRDITEIRTQQELIIDQRDNITSSIHYAKRIQQNLLPHERLFANLFSDHFILYKPKDIVSGDFYWLEDAGDQIVIALGDCTGHGVPGSFMTLLGMNLLKTIIMVDRILDPGKILDKLDERLLEILPRGDNDSQVKDGMEITICTVDKNGNQLAFACAGSRFLLYQNREFTMYKGDNKHIGDIHFDGFAHYQTNFVSIDADDQLFLFTDGFQDQFGGPCDKKYSFRRLLEVFEDGIDLPYSQQKAALEEEFDNWIGYGEQTDDLTIISVRKK